MLRAGGRVQDGGGGGAAAGGGFGGPPEQQAEYQRAVLASLTTDPGGCPPSPALAHGPGSRVSMDSPCIWETSVPTPLTTEPSEWVSPASTKLHIGLKGLVGKP